MKPVTGLVVLGLVPTVRDDLRAASVLDCEYLRYCTLTHLDDQPADQFPDGISLSMARVPSAAINRLNWGERGISAFQRAARKLRLHTFKDEFSLRSWRRGRPCK
jgi:hypothetical protein